MGIGESGADEQEREVLREWLHGAHVDIRVVRRQVAALLRIVEGYGEPEDPLERPESAAEATGGPRAIRWTGDNDEAVRGFLGARYEKIRGGLQDYGPRVVWFRNNDPHGYLSWARAGDWLIEAGGRITTVADEDYEGPR